MVQASLIDRADQKPGYVRLAILLLYGFVVIRFIVMISMIRIVSPPQNLPVSGFIYELFLVAVKIFFIHLVSKGKAWSRNLCLFFYLIGGAFGLWELFPIDDKIKSLLGILFFTYFLGSVPLIILYLRQSRDWFNSFKRS